MQLTKEEIKDLLIVSVIAGFVFSFNEWGGGVFELSTGVKNLFKATLIALIIYTVHILAQKLVANKSSCETRFNIISAKEIPFYGMIKVPNFLRPIGPIITLLISFLSRGKLFFIALASFEIVSKRKYRLGHKWSFVKEREEAVIAAAGPISNILMLILFKIMSPISQSFFTKAMFMASSIAVFHLLPLPKFDGIKIWISSRTLFLLLWVFVPSVIILVYLTGLIAAIVTSLIIAIIVALSYFYRSNK